MLRQTSGAISALLNKLALSRFLILMGIVLVLVGVLWPWLTRLGLGQLPGDIVVHRGNFHFYFPVVTSIVVSIVLSGPFAGAPAAQPLAG
jgi:Protein of unknown function (DUF2905)